MPATAVAPVTVSRNVANGVDLTAALTAADATNGNSFVNDGTTLLRVKNGSGSPVTVTVHFQGTLTPAVDGVTLTGTSAGKQYSVPATTGDRLIAIEAYLAGYSTRSGTSRRCGGRCERHGG